MQDDYFTRKEAALDKIDSEARKFTKESVGKIYREVLSLLIEDGIQGPDVVSHLNQLAVETMWRVCASDFQSKNREHLEQMTRDIYKEFGLNENEQFNSSKTNKEKEN